MQPFYDYFADWIIFFKFKKFILIFPFARVIT